MGNLKQTHIILWYVKQLEEKITKYLENNGKLIYKQGTHILYDGIPLNDSDLYNIFSDIYVNVKVIQFPIINYRIFNISGKHKSLIYKYKDIDGKIVYKYFRTLLARRDKCPFIMEIYKNAYDWLLDGKEKQVCDYIYNNSQKLIERKVNPNELIFEHGIFKQRQRVIRLYSNKLFHVADGALIDINDVHIQYYLADLTYLAKQIS